MYLSTCRLSLSHQLQCLPSKSKLWCWNKILTSIEIKEIKEVKGDLVAPEASALKQLGEKAPIKADIEQITVIKYKGVEYLLRPKKGSGGLVFELFGMADDTFKKALGEMAINPGTGTFKGSKPIFKV